MYRLGYWIRATNQRSWYETRHVYWLLEMILPFWSRFQEQRVWVSADRTDCESSDPSPQGSIQAFKPLEVLAPFTKRWFVSLIDVDLGLTRSNHCTEPNEPKEETNRFTTNGSRSWSDIQPEQLSRNESRVYGQRGCHAGQSSLFYPMTSSCFLQNLTDDGPASICETPCI